jgi:hypothetical protein
MMPSMQSKIQTEPPPIETLPRFSTTEFVTSNLDLKIQKADHGQGGGDARRNRELGANPFAIKILPASCCSPRITLRNRANSKIPKIRGGRGIPHELVQTGGISDKTSRYRKAKLSFSREIKRRNRQWRNQQSDFTWPAALKILRQRAKTVPEYGH